MKTQIEIIQNEVDSCNIQGITGHTVEYLDNSYYIGGIRFAKASDSIDYINKRKRYSPYEAMGMCVEVLFIDGVCYEVSHDGELNPSIIYRSVSSLSGIADYHAREKNPLAQLIGKGKKTVICGNEHITIEL